MYSIRTSKGSAINSQRHWLELSDNWRWNQRKGNEKLLLPFKQFCHYSVLLAHNLVLLSYSLLFRFSPGKIPVPWVYPCSLGVPLFSHVTRNSKQDSKHRFTKSTGDLNTRDARVNFGYISSQKILFFFSSSRGTAFELSFKLVEDQGREHTTILH